MTSPRDSGVYPVRFPLSSPRLQVHGAWCLAGLVSLCSGGCGPMAYKITPIPAEQKLEETTLINEGGLAPAKIVLVEVSGILLNSHKPTLFGNGEQPVSLFTENLDKA